MSEQEARAKRRRADEGDAQEDETPLPGSPGIPGHAVDPGNPENPDYPDNLGNPKRNRTDFSGGGEQGGASRAGEIEGREGPLEEGSSSAMTIPGPVPLAPPSAAVPQRYLLTVEYVGSAFFGFQRQPNVPTVAGALEDALRRLMGEPGKPSAEEPLPTGKSAGSMPPDSVHLPPKLLEIVGSSRTDTGVHALGNTCHVDIVRRSKRKGGQVVQPFPPQQLQRGLNHFLRVSGAEASVVGVRAVSSDFHARFNAIERTYYYRLHSSVGSQSVFQRNRLWHIEQPLDVAAMRSACRVLEGQHDFSSFRAAGCQAASPVKTLTELSIQSVPSWIPQLGTEANSEPCKDTAPQDLVVVARAPSFLYHQVRLLVGTLKAVGCRQKTVEDVQRILDAKDIAFTPAMAPAHGLYLAAVRYPLDAK